MSRGRRPTAVIISWSLLLGTLIIWWVHGLEQALHPIDFVGPALLLPLIIGLVPVARGSARATAAATLLIIPYLGWGLTEILANPGARVYAVLTVVFGFVCFGALIFELRRRRSG